MFELELRFCRCWSFKHRLWMLQRFVLGQLLLWLVLHRSSGQWKFCTMLTHFKLQCRLEMCWNLFHRCMSLQFTSAKDVTISFNETRTNQLVIWFQITNKLNQNVIELWILINLYNFCLNVRIAVVIFPQIQFYVWKKNPIVLWH